MQLQRIKFWSHSSRSAERYKRIAWTSVTSLGAKLTTLVAMLVAVPLTLRYLGGERYGMWMAITSSVLVLTFADLGIGNGLLNAISQSTGKEDHDAVQRYVSSAFFLLLAVAALLAALFLAAVRFVPWERVFNVNSPLAVHEARPAVAVFLACFCISLPLGIVQRIHFGLQEGYSNNLWVAAGSLLGFVALLFAIRKEAGLPWLVLTLAGGPVLALIFNAAFLFRKRPWLIPRWAKSSRKHAWELLTLGMSFVIIQTCLAVASGVDNLIVAHQLGPSAVTQYSVPLRMFSALPVLLIMALNPLWPAYGESFARGDIDWARRALSRSLKVSLSSTLIAGATLVILGPTILTLWVHGRVQATFWLLAGMACWMVLSSAASAISVFLNANNLVRVQVFSAIGMCLSATVLKLFLTPKLGLAAVIWCTDAAYVLFVWIPILIFLPAHLEGLKRQVQQSSNHILDTAPVYE
jgi:O-antigen/teichoic acid export membrane protein